MQTDVHKTLYCFYTAKKMPHESTHSIHTYFEIFSKWSCIGEVWDPWNIFFQMGVGPTVDYPANVASVEGLWTKIVHSKFSNNQ